MTFTWDPDRYLQFGDERGRPFVELIARVGADSPRRVVDLGCGPGNLTALLRERWPEAAVAGVDSSPEMIGKAQSAVPGIDFSVGDVRDWTPIRCADDEGVDVLVTNATLQWVPDHLELLPRLVDALAPQGWIAIQVPGNFDEPSHVIRHQLEAEAPYAEHLAGTARPAAPDAADYLRVLQSLGCEVDAWETTYLHVLHGEDPVFTWISGTSARPALEALPGDLRPEFESELRRRLREAYPDDGHGVVLPFRRVFAVGHRS